VLTPYEVPVHVAVLDALPRTPSSKVSRVELMELVRASLAQKSVTGAALPAAGHPMILANAKHYRITSRKREAV
jgi:hypothetical protein